MEDVHTFLNPGPAHEESPTSYAGLSREKKNTKIKKKIPVKEVDSEPQPHFVDEEFSTLKPGPAEEKIDNAKIKRTAVNKIGVRNMDNDPAASNPGPVDEESVSSNLGLSEEKKNTTKIKKKTAVKKVDADPKPHFVDEEFSSLKPGPSEEKDKNAKIKKKTAIKKILSDTESLSEDEEIFSSKPGPSEEKNKNTKMKKKTAVKKKDSDPESLSKDEVFLSKPGPSEEKNKNTKLKKRTAVKKVASDPESYSEDEDFLSSKPGPSEKKNKNTKMKKRTAVKKVDSDPESHSTEEEPITSDAGTSDEKHVEEVLPESGKQRFTKKSMLKLVCEAIATVGEKRKGASAQKVRDYIKHLKESEGVRFSNALVTKALNKGLEDGILSRPTGKDMVGAKGFFILVKTEPEKTTSKKKENKEKTKETAPKKKPPVENSEKNMKEKNPVKKVVKGNIIPENPNKKARTNRLLRNMSPSSTSTPIKQEENKVQGVKKVNKTNKRGRKDASDTEIIVKKGRKSLKTYSSDTDINLAGKIEKIQIPSKKPPKTTTNLKPKEDAEKHKSVKEKAKKLYNGGKEEKGKPTKKNAKN